MKLVKYFTNQKNNAFETQRRRFLKNASIMLGLFGVAPGIRFDSLGRMSKRLGLDSLYAQSASNAAPNHLIEILYRTGHNLRCMCPPARAAVTQNKRMAVWAGNQDDSGSYQNYTVSQSEQTGVWLPADSNGTIVHAANVPMAAFWYNNSESLHKQNFSIRSGLDYGTDENQPNGRPAFSFLHATLGKRLAIFPEVVRINLNGASVIHNLPSQIGGQQPITFGSGGDLGNNLGLSTAALRAHLQNRVTAIKSLISSFSSDELNVLGSQLQALSESRLTAYGVSNVAEILKSPQYLAHVFQNSVDTVLSLSDQEVAAFAADSSGDQQVFGGNVDNYNLGRWVATVMKAMEYGYIQRAIIEIEITDIHPDSGVAAYNNGGWQEDQMKRGLNALKVMEAFHEYSKQKPSVFSDRSLFDDSLVVITSDLGRTPNTRETESFAPNGAYTDNDQASVIVVGSDQVIQSGTYYNHDDGHDHNLYSGDRRDGLVARNHELMSLGDFSLPGGFLAWDMVAQALVGKEQLDAAYSPPGFFDRWSYLLKS